MAVACLVTASSCHKTQLETRPDATPQQHFSLLLVSTGFKLHKITGENCTLGCDSTPVGGFHARETLCREKWRPYLP